MTLTVPVLYLFGLAFDQGYQSVFLVPAVARSSDFHQTLTLSFFAAHYAVQIVNEWMSNHWPVMMGYGAATGLLVALSVRKKEPRFSDIRQRVRIWFYARPNAMKTSAGVGVSLFVFGIPYVIVGILYVALTVPLLGYLVGKQIAERHLQRHAPTCELAAANPQRFTQCVLAKNGDVTAQGYLVAATSDYFVLTLDGKTRAIPTSGWEFEGAFGLAPRLGTDRSSVSMNE